jgi:hypothetical protein
MYGYIPIILLLGVVAGAIYSISITETLNISGGNTAYGAFMMSTVMLVEIKWWPAVPDKSDQWISA